MSLEDRLDRLISLLEAILLRFAPSPTDPRNSGPFAPSGPPWPNVPVPTPNVDPLYPPGPTGLNQDRDSFDWAEINSLRRIFVGQTKYLPVPAGYDGGIRLEMSASTGNIADLAELIVTDGPLIVGRSGRVNNCYGRVNFKPIGGRSYGVSVEGIGAVVQVNLLKE